MAPNGIRDERYDPVFSLPGRECRSLVCLFVIKAIVIVRCDRISSTETMRVGVGEKGKEERRVEGGEEGK